MTGPLRYTDRDPMVPMAPIEFTDEESAAIIGPSSGFDVYATLRHTLGFDKCNQCTADIIDMLARRRTVYRKRPRR